ncbi:MAG: hypothetical protein WCP21_12135, partial [Armatimonadota bacterium]
MMRPFMSVLCLAAIVGAGAAWAADVYGVPAIQKVTPQQAPAASWSTDGVSLQSARNEWEAFQVVVRSAEAIEAVRFELMDLRGPQGAALPAKLARVYKVEWVDIAAPYEVDKPSDHPDLRADPLVPVKAGETFALEAGKNLVFWIALQVPESAKPGRYDGRVYVSTKGKLLKTLPVALR